jgi:hypothetical protein
MNIFPGLLLPDNYINSLTHCCTVGWVDIGTVPLNVVVYMAHTWHMAQTWTINQVAQTCVRIVRRTQASVFVYSRLSSNQQFIIDEPCTNRTEHRMAKNKTEAHMAYTWIVLDMAQALTEQLKVRP